MIRDPAPQPASGPRTGPRAVILDLDGTLLDTLRDLADSMNDALRGFAFPAHPLAAYREFVGDGAQALAARVLPPAHRQDATIDALYTQYLACYSRRWHHTTRPFPGIPALLDACVSRGLRLAVLSNKSDSFTRLIVPDRLPDWQWAAVRGQRADLPRKPAPDGALAIARELDVLPTECLFIGDSAIDIHCARSAGMPNVGALWGFRSREELIAARADHLAATPEDVIPLLDHGSRGCAPQ